MSAPGRLYQLRIFRIAVIRAGCERHAYTFCRLSTIRLALPAERSTPPTSCT